MFSSTTRTYLFRSSLGTYRLTYVNNSGVMAPPLDLLTKDGFDLQWGTNVVGPYYFTKLLLPSLSAAAATSPDGHSRVITTSSSVAYLDTLYWDTFKDGPARRKRSTEALYHQSKLVRLRLGDSVFK